MLRIWLTVGRYPPGVETVFTDTRALVKPMADLYAAFAEVKKRWLKGRRYWYLNLIARHPERHDRGESAGNFAP
jgi:hypothetical protein